MFNATTAFAQDARAIATQLSDNSFALLNSLTASSGAGNPNPVLGAVASFAADAQSLSSALKDGDYTSAGRAMGALQSDRKSIETAVAAHPNAIDSSDWSGIKNQLDTLSKMVKPAPPGAMASSPSPPVDETPARSTGAAGEASSDIPKIKIDSYAVEGHSVRVRGSFEGRALKSAGIYEGDQLLKPLKVDPVPGMLHIDFDIQLEQVTPDTVLRVYNADGLSAEASLASREALEGTAGAKEVEVGPPSEPPVVALGGGIGETVSRTVRRDNMESDTVDTSRASTEGGPGEGGPGGHNIAEIPSSEPSTASPSKRHIKDHRMSHLGNIRIEIMNLSLEDPSSQTYHVMGSISGKGITRAGIYIDGKLAKELDIDLDDVLSTDLFDESFQMNGREATIRVYGARNQYVETSLRISGALGGPYAVAMNPNRLGVQISSVQPMGLSVERVTGVVQGKHLASAGMYQNGALIQQFSVSGGLLGLLTASSFRQVQFSGQFNPAAGSVTVRVYDDNGQFVEQPISGPGVNPYAANPYRPGVAVSPYGPGAPNPYGPYNPYAPRANPYGYPQQPPPSSAPNTPWWAKILR
jgi:hypothetical protein